MITQEQFDNSVSWVTGLFGPFDPRVQIAGVFPTDQKTPFTGYSPPYDRFHIEIHLPREVEEWGLYRHLTHELVHCLNPNGMPGHQATVLEEGLAEHSGVYFMEANFTLQHDTGEIDTTFWRQSVNDDYKDAFDLVEEVVGYEGLEGMRQGVQVMRAAIGLPFCQITADHMADHFRKTDSKTLAKLGQRFYK